MSKTNAIHFQDISKVFSNESGIREVNFSIKKGSFHALIGANGAGKTTLIRTLLRIYKKYDGEVFINGEVNSNSKSFKGVSYISELPIFPNEFTARQYLMWSGKLAGLNPQKIKIEIDKLSIRFNISQILDKNPNKFSSGQKQKIMLMKILIDLNIPEIFEKYFGDPNRYFGRAKKNMKYRFDMDFNPSKPDSKITIKIKNILKMYVNIINEAYEKYKDMPELLKIMFKNIISPKNMLVYSWKKLPHEILMS